MIGAKPKSSTEKKMPLSIRVTPAVYEAVKLLAAHRHSASELVDMALRRLFTEDQDFVEELAGLRERYKDRTG